MKNTEKKQRIWILAVTCTTLFFVAVINSYGSKTTHEKPHGILSTAQASPQKGVYLTIDLDMSEGMKQKISRGNGEKYYDQKVFDYLIKNKIPATFFVSGLFAETYPDLMKSLAKQNLFSFQNHAWDEAGFVPHCYWLRALTTDKEKIGQINQTQKAIQETTGQTPVYFRFPGICHDSYNDKLVKSLGFKLDNGTVFARDPFSKGAEEKIKRMLKETTDGSVILIHAGGPNAPESYNILKGLAPKLESAGFIFKKF